MPHTQAFALITGVTGQDGWYLAERLLRLGHSVVGTTHRPDRAGMQQLAGRSFEVVHLDLADRSAAMQLIERCKPRAVYNFAARASSAQLNDDPLATADINGVAVVRLLEAIRLHSGATRFCQASSSEVFAGATTSPQAEDTPRQPTSAYGAAKAFADNMIAAYREQHGVFACSAILFPHESQRRPAHFLVRKVCRAAARISLQLDDALVLGDLEAARDWGLAADYVEAMRLMLEQPEPRDCVIATGVAHRVADVCEIAFGHVGLDWRAHVHVDCQLERPPERVLRVGDAARARRELGWAPTMSFQDMIRDLVEHDRLQARGAE